MSQIQITTGDWEETDQRPPFLHPTALVTNFRRTPPHATLVNGNTLRNGISRWMCIKVASRWPTAQAHRTPVRRDQRLEVLRIRTPSSGVILVIASPAAFARTANALIGFHRSISTSPYSEFPRRLPGFRPVAAEIEAIRDADTGVVLREPMPELAQLRRAAKCPSWFGFPYIRFPSALVGTAFS